MTADSTPTPATPTTPTSGGLPASVKAKATEVGTTLYLKAPPKAQNAILVGIGKAQPVVDAIKPHATKLLGAGAGLLALRRFRGRQG